MFSLFFPFSMSNPRVFLVTGANRGLGLEIAAGLVHDYDVILACRRRDACDAAVAEINERHRQQRRNSSSSASTSTSSSPCARAAPLPLDLSSPRSVFEFVEAMKGTEETLDGVVLNAGVSPSPPASSASASSDSAPASSSALLPLPRAPPEGWSAAAVDEALATNHVGHFALVQGLLDNNKIRNGARVVAVSSRASAAGSFEKGGGGGGGGKEEKNITLPALAPRLSSPFKSYSRSKLANVLFCRELARRNSSSSSGGGESDPSPFALSVVASSPGLVETSLARGFALSAASSAVPSWLPLRAAAVSALSFLARGAAGLLGQSPEEGATSSLFAATADEDELFPSSSASSSPPPPSSPSPPPPPLPFRFAFVHGRKRAEWLLSQQARDDELAGRLWEATEAVVAEAKRVWEEGVR